jgi:endonuclease YncB( thermonuclease family)
MDQLREFLFAVLTSIGVSVASIGPSWEGAAQVTDRDRGGDSLAIGNVRFRLHAIDAPEGKQTCESANGQVYGCGERSTAALKHLINRRPVTCSQVDKDRYGRIVAKYFVGELDLGAAMVKQGMAVAYTDFGWDYATLEATARANSEGLWAGRFDTPSDWRRAQQ